MEWLDMCKSTEKLHRKSVLRAAAVYSGLFAFGAAYNWLVDLLERNGLDEGYTSDLVVGGVVVTVAATVPLVGWRGAAMVIGSFVASGLPMSIGAKLRYRRMRQREGLYGWQGAKQGAAIGLRTTTEKGRGYSRTSGSTSAPDGRGAGRR